jgi:hypothetical protein
MSRARTKAKRARIRRLSRDGVKVPDAPAAKRWPRGLDALGRREAELERRWEQG